MELNELEDIFNKITFHFQQIDSNLDMLRYLLETSNLFDLESSDYVKMFLKNFYSRIKEKYEYEKLNLLRGEEENV